MRDKQTERTDTETDNQIGRGRRLLDIYIKYAFSEGTRNDVQVTFCTAI